MLKSPGVLLAASLVLQAPPAQPPPPGQQAPVFRAGLSTVAVPATVYDADGRIVTRLTRQDFLLFDDGRRQEITNFTSGQVPLRVVVLLDASASMMSAIDLARHAAEQFVIRLGPEDAARVGVFSARVAISPEFTADRDALLGVLREDLPFSNPTHLLDAVNDAVAALSGQPGRRVVVVFTDGCDTASDTGWDALIERLYAEDVMVYAVRFRTRILLRDQRPQVGRRQRRGPCDDHRPLELPAGVPLSDFFRLEDPRVTQGPALLARMAVETGGTAVPLAPGDDANRLFTAIVTELHHQYLLGFSPSMPDGKVHQLSVRVPDRSLVVRARRAYLAPPPPSR